MVQMMTMSKRYGKENSRAYYLWIDSNGRLCEKCVFNDGDRIREYAPCEYMAMNRRIEIFEEIEKPSDNFRVWVDRTYTMTAHFANRRR